MAPLLIDLAIDGTLRKVVVYGSKSGQFYILISPLAPPGEFSTATWRNALWLFVEHD